MANEHKRAITVSELIEALSKFNPNMPVGRTGHFGEFFGYEKTCVRETKTTSEGWAWRVHVPEFDYIDIEAPYIGEEPD